MIALKHTAIDLSWDVVLVGGFRKVLLKNKKFNTFGFMDFRQFKFLIVNQKNEHISFNQYEMYLKVGLVNLHNSGSGLFL